MSYNQFDGDPPISSDEAFDEFVSVGIVAAFLPGSIDDDASQFFVPEFEVRRFFPQTTAERVLKVGGSSGFLAEVDTVVGTAVIKLAFNANSKTLSVFQNDDLLTVVEIDGSSGIDWGMEDSDTFRIILLGDSFNEPIDPADPITFDNFEATVLIPEPTACCLAILAGLAFVRGHRR